MTKIRQLANDLATDLFTNGAGAVAARLVLELPNGREGGGLSHAAVVSRIATHMELLLLQLIEPAQPATVVSQKPA